MLSVAQAADPDNEESDSEESDRIEPDGKEADSTTVTNTPRADAGTDRRVVVTGIGIWSPLGTDRESTWKSLVAGQSASQWLAPPYWTGTSRLAGAPCQLPSESVEVGIDPVMSLARQAATEAIADARLDAETLAAETTGVVFGTSKGGLQTASRILAGQQITRNWLDIWPSSAATHVASQIGCRGPVIAPVLACATGLAACLRGFELIRDGRCDVVIAGSSDASLQPAILGSFQRLGVLARPGSDPSMACQPFDQNRSGFVVGEGAGCLILESLEHALARRGRWYAEWIGGRMLSDPSGLTQLDPAGTSLKRLLTDLIRTTGQLPEYINLHGTATIPNDRVESQSLREVLGENANRIACSSLKGGLGHLLGAAGSVELAAAILAIRDQIVPPTVNLRNPDPELKLNFTPHHSEKRRIDRVWKLSLGFGGHLSAACVGRLAGTGDRTNASASQ